MAARKVKDVPQDTSAEKPDDRPEENPQDAPTPVKNTPVLTKQQAAANKAAKTKTEQTDAFLVQSRQARIEAAKKDS